MTDRPETPKPGLYPDVAREIYHAWDACHYSVLKLFEKSAAHAQEALLHPKEPTEALTRGDAIHAAVLEPDRFLEEYVAAPVLDRRRKADKDAWAAFEAEHASKVVLKAEDHEAAVCIAAALRARETSRDFLNAKGHTEVSVVGIDPDYGFAVKIRPDRFCQWVDTPTVIDLKSTRDASPQGFGTEIARYGYHVQAAFYLKVLDDLALHGGRRFVFLAVEPTPPYASCAYVLDRESLAQGRLEVDRYLARYAEAVAKGFWPGYPGGLHEVRLPQWRFTFDEER